MQGVSEYVSKSDWANQRALIPSYSRDQSGEPTVLGDSLRASPSMVWRSIVGNGPNAVSESTVSNTKLSEFFGPHRAGVPLSLFVCVPMRTHRVFRRTRRVFVYFSYVFRILVSGGGSGCILGCILEIKGVLYSVRALTTHTPLIKGVEVHALNLGGGGRKTL